MRQPEAKKVTETNRRCAALMNGPMGPGALAGALGYSASTSRGFRNLRDTAQADGLIAKNADGDWELN